MDDSERLRLMQTRIVKSYAWQRDVIVPLSKDFDCTVEELEEVFFNLFNMDTLEAMHGTFSSAEDICLYQKFNADLRLCWFSGTLEVIDPEDARQLKMKLVKEVKNGFECGMLIENFNDIKEGDIIECYEMVEKSE